jgi:hypothetical protein
VLHIPLYGHGSLTILLVFILGWQGTMLENASDARRPLNEDSSSSHRAVEARALNLLTQESSKELLSSSSAQRITAVSHERNAGEAQSRGYLETWVNAGTSSFIAHDETRNTVNRLAVDFAKTATLFTGGKLGMAGTFLAYGLDQARPHDSWQAQLADFTLGGAKGEAMKGMFSVVGTTGMAAPLKGALMGVGSGALNEVMKRETFTDPASLNNRLARNAFNPQVILMNAAVFTAGEGLYTGINAATRGVLAEKPMIAGMVMGGSFGFVNGTVQEAAREMQEKGTINPGKVLLHGALDAGVSAAGAGVGMKLSDPVFQKEVKDSALKAVNSARLSLDFVVKTIMSPGSLADVQTVKEALKDPAMVQALFNQLKPALEVYHTGGRSNGGGVDGIQLPPGVNKEQLPAFIEKLSSFLASTQGIEAKLPAPGQTAAELRTQIEHQSADAVKEHRQLYLSAAVDKIENPVIAAMVRDALKQAPPEFFTAPSSSSGKHHPADEINVGGLSLHSGRTVAMAEKLIDFYNREAVANVVGNQKIAGDKLDLILGGLVVHDILKGGVPWKKYDPAHGPLGAEMLKGVWQSHPRQDFAGKMEELVFNHMAQWTKTPGNIAAPRPPQDIANQIASYADYLGSQRDVYVKSLPGRDN